MAQNIEMNWFNGSGYEALYPENQCLKLSGGTMTGPIINGSGSSGAGNDYQIRTEHLGERSGIGHTIDSSGNGGIGIFAYNVTTGEPKGTSMVVSANNTISCGHVEDGYSDYPRITGVGNPINDHDVVTKNYISNIIGSGSYKGNGGNAITITFPVLPSYVAIAPRNYGYITFIFIGAYSFYVVLTSDGSAFDDVIINSDKKNITLVSDNNTIKNYFNSSSRTYQYFYS